MLLIYFDLRVLCTKFMITCSCTQCPVNRYQLRTYIFELGPGMRKAAHVLYVYRIVVKISIDIVTVTLQRFQFDVINEVYQYVSVSAAMLRVSVFSFFVEEDYDACLLVDQPPQYVLRFTSTVR